MASYSSEAFEQIGKAIRVALEIDDQIRLDPIDFLRRLKHAGYIADYVRLPDTALQNAEAKYSPGDRKIYLRESVFASAQGGDPHSRFTVFHEGSHAILDHKHERKRRFSPPTKFEKRIRSIRQDDEDAYKLAAAIMAPFHKANFKLETKTTEISDRFGLGTTASSIRYEEFARLYRRAHNLPRPVPQGIVDFLGEQRRRGFIVKTIPDDEVAKIYSFKDPLHRRCLPQSQLRSIPNASQRDFNAP
jgi:Zn-dependent peptidase ImmA (M78 family)